MIKHASLQGKEVAITGRLASMSRSEAVERIDGAGATYVKAPMESTAWLIVGEAGWPLRDDGYLTHNLVKARELQEAGSQLRIASETEFLQALGLSEQVDNLHRLYTSLQLSRILGVPLSQVRTWRRSGLIHPVRVVKRLAWFEFRQVALARALLDLTRSGVTPARIRKSLEQLACWLPEAEHLLGRLAGFAEDGSLMFRLQGGRMTDARGQLHFDFEEQTPPVDFHSQAGQAEQAGHADAAKPLPGAMRSETAPSASPARDETSHTAEDWFQLGVEAEDRGNLVLAAQAYEHSLLAAEPMAETCFNLGNVLYTLERKTEALEHYQQAVDIDPQYVEAWNNLGNALADFGRHEEAVRAFQKALELEPRYADAHSNLATTFEQLGRTADARRHWEAYLREDPTSAFANQIRDRLESR